MKLRSDWISGLVLCIVLTACTPERLAPTETPVAAATAAPRATASPTAEATDTGIPAIDYTNGGSVLTIISSMTGQPLEGPEQIPLGTYYSYAFSPDKRSLAVTSAAQLYLIDMPSWISRVADVGLHGLVSSVIYSPDGRLVALASGGPEGYLRIVNAQNGEVEASGQAGFSIRNVKFTGDGKAIMVYGPQLASAGIAANAGVSTGAPKVALFASSDLSLLWSTALSGVRDGTFPKKADIANTQEVYQPGAAWHFQPGAVFAPDRDILYVVHGDADQLTTIEFGTRRAKTVDIRPRLSWLDQLLALTAGVAYAKGMDGTTKQAVVSPDGKYLSVVGSTEAVTQQPNGRNWDITDTPIGLQVIATADGTLIDKIETDANLAALSPDGQDLMLIGWKMNSNSSTPWTDVYELSANRLVKHLANTYLFSTRRLDGKAILASSNQISPNRCDMVVMDPGSWSPTASWSTAACAGWLIDP
jgi:hypothetical protein